MKPMEELTPELISDSPGPGRGRRSIAPAKTSSIPPPFLPEAGGHSTTDGGSGDKESGGSDLIRKTLRPTNHMTVPASEPTFAENEDGDPNNSDFEPETSVDTAAQRRSWNVAERPGRAVDNESDSESGSNYHFDPDQSPDVHSFAQGIDHDDDTGSEAGDGEEDLEAMDIDRFASYGRKGRGCAMETERCCEDDP